MTRLFAIRAKMIVVIVASFSKLNCTEIDSSINSTDRRSEGHLRHQILGHRDPTISQSPSRSVQFHKSASRICYLNLIVNFGSREVFGERRRQQTIQNRGVLLGYRVPSFTKMDLENNGEIVGLSISIQCCVNFTDNLFLLFLCLENRWFALHAQRSACCGFKTN